MSYDSSNRKRRWLVVWAWVGIIYATLYFVRPICTFLKEVTPFDVLVNILCLLCLSVVLTVVFFKKSAKLTFGKILLLICVILAYVYGMMMIQYPEEKIHFIEYGILAYLIFRAVDMDYSRPVTFGISFVLVSMLGWLDEGIQYILPNRYYQIEDVLLNSVSGFLGLVLVYIFTGNKHERV